jgi:hypothetical protein
MANIDCITGLFGGFVQCLTGRRTHRLRFAQNLLGNHLGSRTVLAAQEARHGGGTK